MKSIKLIKVGMAVIGAILFLAVAQAKGQSDTFDGTVIDTSKWEVAESDGSTVIQNDALFITCGDSPAPEFSNTPGLFGPGPGIGSRCKLSGDFDIQVDFFEYTPVPGLNWSQLFFNVYQDPTKQLHIKRITGTSVNGIQTVYTTNGTNRPGSGVTPFSGNAGTFRIVRIGSTVRTYYNAGAGFVQHWLIPAGYFTGDVVVTLNLSAPSVVIDNFLVNSGTFVCPPSNSPPVANAGPDQAAEQTSALGAEVELDGSGSSDPDGDTLTYEWIWPTGSASGISPTVLLPPGLTTVTLTVSDGQLSDTDTVNVTVHDTTPPEVFIGSPEQHGLYAVGSLELDFWASDAVGVSQLWGTLADAAGYYEQVNPGFVPGPGVYTLVVTATDIAGNSTDSEPVFFVVYDPSGGFVTGGGWIDSPVDERYDYMHVGGKASFGFVSKYKKGATVPTGQTEFVFRAGDLNFHSSSYQWLVVTGSNYARFKGTGTINGDGPYRFMLWGGDGQPDTFRIRIWEEDGEGTEFDVYDNGFDQAIGGGSIVVHAD